MHAEHLADRVRQRGHLPAAFGNACNALSVQHQAVNQAVGQTARTAVFNVKAVGGDDFVRVRFQRVRDGK